MNRISMLGVLMASCAMLATSCAKDNNEAAQETVDGKIPVTFSMKTNGLMTSVTRAPSTTYTADGFRIFAFKQSDDQSQWLFTEELALRNLTFTSTPTGGSFSGQAYMDEGTYRFIPTYGLDADDTDITINNFVANAAWDDASPVLIEHNTGSMPEIFTLDAGTAGFDGLTNLTVAIGGANSYSASISRAQARVDVLIVRATGNQSTYAEEANATSVFGEKTLETATIQFYGNNTQMNYFGTFVADPNQAGSIMDYTITGDAVDTDVLIGTAATGATYGTSGYQGYNAVAAADVLQGAAHLYGPFMIPNADATPTQSATLTFTDTEGTIRTLNVTGIPLQRNYVTIIKIYLLETGDPSIPIPPDIWSQDVTFAVTMDTQYAGNNTIDGGTIGGQPAS